MRRPRISRVIETGVRSIDGLLTLGQGQRVGIFAGSGVGKSTLLGMIVRHIQADIRVIALIMGLSPITVLMFSAIRGIEHVGPLQWLGTALALAGALLIISGGHWDKLVAKLPAESVSRLLRRMNGLCTREERDTFVAFFKDKARDHLGGQKAYDQALEAIEMCVAVNAR